MATREIGEFMAFEHRGPSTSASPTEAIGNADIIGSARSPMAMLMHGVLRIGKWMFGWMLVEEQAAPAQKDRVVPAQEDIAAHAAPSNKEDDLAAWRQTQTVVPPIESLAETVGTADKGIGSGRFEFKFDENTLCFEFTYNNQTTTYALDELFPAVNTQKLPANMSFITTAMQGMSERLNQPIKVIRGDGQRLLMMNLVETDPKNLFVQDHAMQRDIQHSIDTNNTMLGIKASLLVADVGGAKRADQVQTPIHQAPSERTIIGGTGRVH